jgi:siroheme synthase-like protein
LEFAMRTPKRPLYPVFLDVAGCPVLVVGGGEVALRKVATLLESGAVVTVISPSVHADLAALLKRAKKQARSILRTFRDGDLRGDWRLVFAATHDEKLNQRIAAAARKRYLWVNVAWPAESGNMQVPASIRTGGVCVAFSTGGASAALARSLRQRLEKSVGAEWGELAQLLAARRDTIQRRIGDGSLRSALMKDLGDARWAGLIKRKGVTAAAREMDLKIKTVERRWALAKNVNR